MNIQDVPRNILEEGGFLRKRNRDLYCVAIKGKWFIFKLLTRYEFSILTSPEFTVLGCEEEFILKNCLLYPEADDYDIDNELAGTVSSLVNIIVSTSGFESADTLLKNIQSNRDLMELADNQMIILLCKAFPHLKLDDINDFDLPKLAYHLALAEQILGVTLDLKPEKPKDKTKQKTKGGIDFKEENNALFKAETSKFKPPEDINLRKLRGNNG